MERISACIVPLLESAERLCKRHDAVSCLSTSFPNLDKLTGGLQPQSVLVVASRPSMGRTALALNIIDHVAVGCKHKAAFFSLGLNAERIAQRLACSRAQVSWGKIRDGFVKEQDFSKVALAASELQESTIFIDGTAGLSYNVLASRVEKLHQEHGIDLLVVDNLHLMQPSSLGHLSNREARIELAMCCLRNLANELNIPVVALICANPASEHEDDLRLRADDLEGEAVFDYADAICLLDRLEYYEQDIDAREAVRDFAELIIVKNAYGPTGQVNLTFRKEYARFIQRA